tara:strand:- start:26872 stop:27741 length:870 start_codon:yes stop_codon:yes gene_type:complete
MSEETIDNEPTVSATAQSLFESDTVDHSEQPIVTPDSAPTNVDAPVESGSIPDNVVPENVVPIVQPVAVVPLVQQQVQPVVQQQTPQQQFQPPVAQQAPPVKQFTQQEINQQLGVYNVTEADYDAIFDVDDKQQSIKALDTMLQKAVRQAVLMSKVLVERETANIEQGLQPYKQYADSYREQDLQMNFYSSHPELKGQDELVKMVITQMQHEGRKFDDNKQLFDEVGNRTKAAIQQFAVNGQGAPQPTAPQTTARKPAMATLSSGGQAGQAGSGTPKVSGTNTAKNLFG